MKYCSYCGKALADEVNFCDKCGRECTTSTTVKTDKWFDRLTKKINEFAGGTGSVHPPIKTIFGGVLERHTKSESEEIFICGTSSTTPELSDDGKAWPRTWLWSRILLVFVITFALLHLCCASFGNLNAYPGLMVIGAFMVPIAVLVFFFELNTPKNISFFSVIKYFLIGGCASLVVTLMLNDFLEMDLNPWLDATFTGIIEEVAKLAIVAFIIWRNKNAKYALNGMLIGAAIGAGFAAFESAGFAFNIFMGDFLDTFNISSAYDEMIENIFLRAILAPGGHVIWAAMSGYAVMLVKGDKELDMSFLNKKAFWKLFWIPIVLHAIWDMPISIGSSIIGALLPIFVLIAIGWLVVFVLIGNSLSEIGSILERKRLDADIQL